MFKITQFRNDLKCPLFKSGNPPYIWASDTLSLTFECMTKIKFGTDGWRAVIAKDFTVENVERVAYATALWLKQHTSNSSAVVGNDCRFGGRLFSETVARVLASEGIKVYLAENEFVSTPMISLGTVRLKADLGIIITASHNPPSWNGYKIKSHYGGPASPKVIEEVEDLIPDSVSLDLEDLEEYRQRELVTDIDLEEMYRSHVQDSFDLNAIRDNLELAYDAMYGAGQDVMRQLFPDITYLHADYNPGFDGQAPEPIHKNLQELSETIKLSENIDAALATDGDADRIGLYNAKGEFIDSHHIILLLINYLHKYKGMTGQVISTFSCTRKIADLCAKYGLKHSVTKIGFKYICDLIVNAEEPVLIGGEESGGISVTGHIPERDGIWIGLVIWEYMAKSGKSLDELIEEIYQEVGRFAVERYDLHVSESQKQSIIADCKSGKYDAFGSYQVEQLEDLDGYKFHLGDGRWVMIRPSGTEPVLRVYAEAESSADAIAILDTVKGVLLN